MPEWVETYCMLLTVKSLIGCRLQVEHRSIKKTELLKVKKAQKESTEAGVWVENHNREKVYVSAFVKCNKPLPPVIGQITSITAAHQRGNRLHIEFKPVAGNEEGGIDDKGGVDNEEGGIDDKGGVDNKEGGVDHSVHVEFGFGQGATFSLMASTESTTYPLSKQAVIIFHNLDHPENSLCLMTTTTAMNQARWKVVDSQVPSTDLVWCYPDQFQKIKKNLSGRLGAKGGKLSIVEYLRSDLFPGVGKYLSTEILSSLSWTGYKPWESLDRIFSKVDRSLDLALLEWFTSYIYVYLLNTLSILTHHYPFPRPSRPQFDAERQYHQQFVPTYQNNPTVLLRKTSTSR